LGAPEPNVKLLPELLPSLAAGVVFGGLPKPNPTGFPMLPLPPLPPGLPNPANGLPPNPKEAGVVVDLSGEDVLGEELLPNVEFPNGLGLSGLGGPKRLVDGELLPPKRFVEGVVSFGFDDELPKRFVVLPLPKAPVDPPKREVDFPESFDEEESEVDEPKVNADLTSEGLDSGSFGVKEAPRANVGAGGPVEDEAGVGKLKPPVVPLVSKDGLNPPDGAEPFEEDSTGGLLKNDAGGVGIARGFAGAEVIGAAPKRLFEGAASALPVLVEVCLSQTFWIVRRLELY